jgi:hypothetical protein
VRCQPLARRVILLSPALTISLEKKTQGGPLHLGMRPAMNGTMSGSASPSHPSCNRQTDSDQRAYEHARYVLHAREVVDNALA